MAGLKGSLVDKESTLGDAIDDVGGWHKETEGDGVESAGDAHDARMGMTSLKDFDDVFSLANSDTPEATYEEVAHLEKVVGS